MDVKICKLDKKICTHLLSMHRSISYLLCILSSWAQHVLRDPDIAPFCKDHLANHTRTTPRETCTKEIHEVKRLNETMTSIMKKVVISSFAAQFPQFPHFPPASNAPGWISSAFEWNPRSLGSKAPSHDCTIPAQIHPRWAQYKNPPMVSKLNPTKTMLEEYGASFGERSFCFGKRSQFWICGYFESYHNREWCGIMRRLQRFQTYKFPVSIVKLTRQKIKT